MGPESLACKSREANACASLTRSFFATQLPPLLLVTSPCPCLIPSFLLLCLPCLCNCSIIAFLLSSKGGPMFF